MTDACPHTRMVIVPIVEGGCRYWVARCDDCDATSGRHVRASAATAELRGAS